MTLQRCRLSITPSKTSPIPEPESPFQTRSRKHTLMNLTPSKLTRCGLPLLGMLLVHEATLVGTQAAVVISNLTPPSGWAGNNIYVAKNWNHAVSFTTGSSATTVDNVKFMLYVVPDANGGDRGVGTHVSFYSNNSGSPGSRLSGTSDLVNPSFGSGAGGDGTFTFTPASSITLAANTTYWIKLANDTDVNVHQSISMFSMGANGSTTSTTASGFTYNTMKSGTDSAGWASSNFYPYPAFSLSVTAVPEPASTAAAVGTGLLILAGWRRSQKKAIRSQSLVA